MKYFNAGWTVGQVKAEYRRLAMRWHPDRGGDTPTMQAINEEYTQALRNADGEVSYDADNNAHEYRYNEKRESAVMEFLDKLIRSGALQPDVECELIGTWVWVTGDTKPVKDLLKAVGCRWHSKRVAWYWRPAGYRTFYNPNASLETLAAAYGATRIKGKQKDDAERIAA
jgi:hypothetical protein